MQLMQVKYLVITLKQQAPVNNAMPTIINMTSVIFITGDPDNALIVPCLTPSHS